MDIELIDKAWACLPKEFKEEVKEIYLNAMEHHPCGYNHKTDLLKYLFGHHNLTSDANEEEMLCVRASQAKELYQYAEEREKGRAPRESEEEWYQGYMKAMQDLFGSKCLPDELNEDNFAKSEPKPDEPKENQNPSNSTGLKPQDVDKQFDNILKDSFRNERRLNIAAMAMQGLLNATSVERFTLRISPEAIAEAAFEYADALINMNKKGVTP